MHAASASANVAYMSAFDKLVDHPTDVHAFSLLHAVSMCIPGFLSECNTC
jgi:hypothetical protein